MITLPENHMGSFHLGGGTRRRQGHGHRLGKVVEYGERRGCSGNGGGGNKGGGGGGCSWDTVPLATALPS